MGFILHVYLERWLTLEKLLIACDGEPIQCFVRRIRGFDVPDRKQLKRIAKSIHQRMPNYYETSTYRALPSEQQRYLWLVPHSVDVTILFYRLKLDVLLERFELICQKVKRLFLR